MSGFDLYNNRKDSDNDPVLNLIEAISMVGCMAIFAMWGVLMSPILLVMWISESITGEASKQTEIKD